MRFILSLLFFLNMDEMETIAAMLHKFGFEGQSNKPDEMCLQLNPASSKFKVLIKEKGSDRAAQPMKPNKTGVVDLSMLQNKEYDVTIIAPKLKPVKILQHFFLKKDEGGISIRGVDTGATLIDSLFRHKDKDVSNAVVLGDFKDKNGNTFKLKGKTNESGKFQVILPPGTLSDYKATSKDHTVIVPKRGTLTIPEYPPSKEIRKVTCIRVELDASTFASAVEPSKDKKIVILGDISGSMGAGRQMEVLRKSFQEIASKSVEQQCPFAMGAWDTRVDWASSTWITAASSSTNSFILSLRARGGNDMRNAITEGMRKFSDATDVYVMCDGDISPFCVGTDGGSWKPFRLQYPRVTFHFIALGKASHAEQMQQMADIGGGDFLESS